MRRKKVKRKHNLILVSFFVVMILAGCSDSTLRINDVLVHLEIADTPEERGQGLMFREELCDSCGMLFVFEEEEKHSFWMKDTLLPLDMIFLDEDGVVVDVISADPCAEEPCVVYTPRATALTVLEVNQGFVDTYGISVGDHVTFSVSSL